MIDILMATYNGEKYVAKQIESIIGQTEKNWRLFVSDDCSTDKTVEIVRKYVEKYPDKIFISVKEKNSGSPALNFFDMIKASNADYILTCDQDDVWDKDKVKKTVKAIGKTKTPVLVHTDLRVVDENLNVISESMIKRQHIDVGAVSINRLVVQNVVTGCTMGFNRALADVLKYPQNIPVHDWWIACTAAIFGKIIFIPESTLLYRQHGGNTCGAQNMNSVSYLAKRIKNIEHSHKMLDLSYVMALDLLNCYAGKMDEDYTHMLCDYVDAEQKSKLGKIQTVAKYGIWKSGAIRKLGQLLLM